MTAYTSPKTYTAGVAHTAAEGNTYIRDNIKNLDERLTLIGQTSVTVVGQLKTAAYGCVLIRTATQSINDAADTAVTFPTGSMTEELDSDGFHSGASNTARITVPSGGDGWYMIGANVAFDINATGNRAVWVELNGSAGTGTTIINQNNASFATFANRFTIGAPYLLAAGDYVTLNVRQNSGGALNLLANDYSVRFWALRLFSV
jgi:hypothetical protein